MFPGYQIDSITNGVHSAFWTSEPFKKLYEKYAGTDAHWGLLSWRWHEKTKLAGYQFKTWIEQNPEYDCYHFDPFKNLSKDALVKHAFGENFDDVFR
jgi:hypothetical protein